MVRNMSFTICHDNHRVHNNRFYLIDDDHNEVFSPWQLLESADEYESSESEFDNGEASDQENVHMDDANCKEHRSRNIWTQLLLLL